MRARTLIQYFFCLVTMLTMVACTSEETPETMGSMQPLVIKNVVYNSSWGGVTRTSTTTDAHDKQIWVSANDATPSQYAYNSTDHKFEVTSGSPQEWNGVTAIVYGFFNSANANRVNTLFSVAVAQNGTQSYDFQASAKGSFTYSVQNSDGVTLALRQQLAHVNLTVEDADANTQVLMGNSQLYCSGMFQYTAPDAGSYFQTSEGYWAFTGNRQTMTLTSSSGGTTFSAYLLPQSITTKSHFFRVYNTSTGRSAYYAWPNDIDNIVEGNEYTCILRQNMNVASIQVDEDFSNNSGDTKQIYTDPSN